ncbi:hypothetical protein GCK72_012730 [Caenorhabditis remanei]|uniref:G-protein coupled receptors family 1 profile domain-containing protein n=1 Tax=Caenorhabditis remanei TaxID=31234 RepID=A0A6A5GLX5_CAERE|nr:hypothetical protein GCK72_012730 [Caenorhabditis remanei]KAF1756277.1 hypothetical protein GCK72_012730 [Caenorhabditis remanei]
MDILAAGTSGLLLERFLSTGDTILIISRGCCTSHISCFSGHILFISFLQHNLIWLVFSYFFRYCILHRTAPPTQKVIFAAVACYLPNLIHSVIWINMFAENKISKAPKIFSKPSDQVMAGWVVEKSSWAVLVLLGISSVLVFAFYLLVRYNLVVFMRKNTARLSKNAFVFHRKLLETAHLQSSIPILILTGTVLFFAMHFTILNPIHVQYLPSILFTLTTIISPISYFIFLPPQWNFCFGVSKGQKESSMTATNNGIRSVNFAISVF